ncbi:MAG: glutathione S-transferase N-terminal domain-containing protein, partial [Pseudomonadota bacterium]
MYKLIGSIRTRAARVAWLLEELDLEYEYVHAPPRSEAVLEHYSAGKIPVLVVDDQPLTDSVAIMTYLADTHGKLTFPAGTIERAVQDGHTHFINEEMDAILWMASRHGFILPEDKRVPEVRDSLMWEYERSMTRLEDR